MAERRVLAVDGGQSAIRVRHSAGGGTALVTGVSRQEGDVVGAAIEAVIQGWRVMGSPTTDRVVLGLSTAPAEVDAQARLCTEVGETIGATETWLCDDAVTAHAGARSLRWGVNVTAGTGVACLALPEADDAPPRLIGGHGFLLGDEGGAFWMGREGLRAVLRAADGRGPATALTAAAAARFDGLADLSARIHALPRAVNAIAHFAPDVLAAAVDGDAEALRIADAALEELVTLIRAGVAAAAGPAPRARGSVPVALGGPPLEAGSVLRERLDRAAAAAVPSAAIADPDGAPLDGAMALGMRLDPGRYASLVVTWRSDT